MGPGADGKWFYMPERDWNRFGTHLEALSEFSSTAHDAFLLFLGAGIGSAVAIVVWLGELSQTKDPTVVFIVAGITLLIITLACFAVATISRLQEGALKGRMKRDAELLHDDMHHVHPFEK